MGGKKIYTRSRRLDGRGRRPTKVLATTAGKGKNQDIVKVDSSLNSDEMSEQSASPNRRPSGFSTIQPFANAHERFFSIGGGR